MVESPRAPWPGDVELMGGADSGIVEWLQRYVSVAAEDKRYGQCGCVVKGVAIGVG